MKMKFRNYLQILILFLSIQNLYSQVRLGVHGGLNLSSVSFRNLNIFSSGISTGIGFLPAYSFGIDINYKIVDNYSFSSGINYSVKGYKVTSFGVRENYYYSYLEIPFLFSYKPQNISVDIGPYVSFALNEVIKNSLVDNINYGRVGNSQADGDTLKPLDLGIKLGLGFDLKNLLFKSSIAFGISNVWPGRSGNSVKNISTEFLFGIPLYLFNEKDKKK